MELTCLALKITSLKFLKYSFFCVGVYCKLYGTFKGFHIFMRGVYMYIESKHLVLQNQFQCKQPKIREMLIDF